MKIKRIWNNVKGWFDYDPLMVTVVCLNCGHKAEAFTWQIFEKQYHRCGKLFCPHCKGKIRPIEKLELIKVKA